MIIIVKVKGPIGRFKNERILKIVLSRKASVNNILNRLSIKKKYISLITINNKKGNTNSILKDKDELTLFPFIIGG